MPEHGTTQEATFKHWPVGSGYTGTQTVLGMEDICFPFASQNNPMEVFVKVHRLCVWRWWRTRTDQPSPLYWAWAPRNHGPHPRFPIVLVYISKGSVSRLSTRPCHVLMKLTIKNWPISFGKEIVYGSFNVASATQGTASPSMMCCSVVSSITKLFLEMGCLPLVPKTAMK